jgi:signal transduction histidine kinase
MTIKAKLIFSYAVMLAIVLAMAVASIWSIVGWGRAAGQLTATYSKGFLAERLRLNMTRQINFGHDFLYGDITGRDDFWKAQDLTKQLIDELKAGSSSDEEFDHIRGLEETQNELLWVMKGMFERDLGAGRQAEREASQGRLREISDEVSDDIATLNQYYRAWENRNITGANRAGTIAMIVIGSAAVIAVLQLIALIILLQRWLALPISLVGKATREISSGNFDTEVPIRTKDEWGELAGAINRMSQTLKASQHRLLIQERLAALGEIGSYTAHNLRNPLAGIRAAAQVALSEQPSPSAEITESLRDIINAVDRMDDWIKRFLTYAKPLQPDIARHDLNFIISQAANLAHQAHKAKAKLIMSLDKNIGEIDIDGILIEQVIQVIAANAFEAIDIGGRVEIQSFLEKGAGTEARAVISITDDGKGIPASIKNRLFKPFSSTKEGGTGLGLAQAKKIIDMHGGQIGIESLTIGTKVSISLPVYRPL